MAPTGAWSIEPDSNAYEMEPMLGRGQRSNERGWRRFTHFTFSLSRARVLSSEGVDLPVLESSRLHRTEFLDGLRGFAALLVFVTHHEGWAHSQNWNDLVILESPWGHGSSFYFIRFPLVRVFFTGSHLGVTIFFIISGYVLTHKPLCLIHEDKTDKLVLILSSAIFRRWIRLFVPVFATTFILMTSWHAFGFKSLQSLDFDPKPTYVDELRRWVKEMLSFSYIFNSISFNGYNDHTWTIPVDYRGSIITFTALLALAGCSNTKRLICQIILILYFLYLVDGWSVSCFLIGMLACDLDTQAASATLPRPLRRWMPKTRWFYFITLCVGIYIGSVPEMVKDIEELRQSLGWHYLSTLIPSACTDFRMFYRTWGAALVLISTMRLVWLQSFFESSFCQFLGKISFSLYLVHGPILWTLGARLYAATGRTNLADPEYIRQNWANTLAITSWGPYGLEINFVVPFLLLFLISLAVAWLTNKFVDEPSIKLSQRLCNVDCNLNSSNSGPVTRMETT